MGFGKVIYINIINVISFMPKNLKVIWVPDYIHKRIKQDAVSEGKPIWRFLKDELEKQRGRK